MGCLKLKSIVNPKIKIHTSFTRTVCRTVFLMTQMNDEPHSPSHECFSRDSVLFECNLTTIEEWNKSMIDIFFLKRGVCIKITLNNDSSRIGFQFATIGIECIMYIWEMMGTAMCVSVSKKAILLSTTCYGMPNLDIKFSLKQIWFLVEIYQSHDGFCFVVCTLLI